MPAPSSLGAILEPLNRIAPPEYVVLRKLEFLREGGQDKHVRDVRFVRAATVLDVAFVEQEVARLGLQQEWLHCTPTT